jgi:hypothetical protein
MISNLWIRKLLFATKTKLKAKKISVCGENEAKSEENQVNDETNEAKSETKSSWKDKHSTEKSKQLINNTR